MAAARELTPVLGLARGASARHRAQVQRASAAAAFVGPAQQAPRPRPPLALNAQENDLLLATLNSQRFADTAPAAVHATVLDEGRYLGSVRTMYRLLTLLDVAKSHSRPHVSDDKPYSESQFKTMKYRPDFPTSRRASAASRMPGFTARLSLLGTTTSTGIRASAT